MATLDYDKVEQLIFKGFLTTQVNVCEVPIVLKTLSQTEFDLITLQGEDFQHDWQIHSAYYLAYSTLFFNRAPVLPYRREVIPWIAEHYKDLPESVLVSLLLAVNRLNQEARDELQRVQPYSYGKESRDQWLQLQGLSLCDESVTGLEGSRHMGLNYHQKIWSFLNRQEDRNDTYLDAYTLTKFIVSPHAPKEIRKRDQKDKKKLKQLAKFRRKIHSGQDAVFGDERQIKVSAETAEELLDQMERTIRGEKDYHDLVIEQHQRKVRAAYLRREQEKERKREIARQRRQALLEGKEPYQRSIEGLSREEVEHLRKKNAEKLQEERGEDWVDPSTMAEREQNLLRWGFLDIEDIPSSRKEWYDPRSYKEGTAAEDTQNPLIKDYYEQVDDDLEDL